MVGGCTDNYSRPFPSPYIHLSLKINEQVWLCVYIIDLQIQWNDSKELGDGSSVQDATDNLKHAVISMIIIISQKKNMD